MLLFQKRLVSNVNRHASLRVEHLEKRQLMAADLLSMMSSQRPIWAESETACISIPGSFHSNANSPTPSTGNPSSVGSSMNVSGSLQELWVAPAKNDHSVGTWPATSKGEANFVFGVPTNLTGVSGAKIVGIAKKTESSKFDIEISVAKHGEDQDAAVSEFDDQGPVSLIKDRLVEIDISALMPSALTAGQDNVSIEFELDKKSDLRILGLRFLYEGAAGTQGPAGPQGPAGTNGATGPAGPQGATGPQGPMGPIGPTGPQGNDGAVGPQGLTGAPGPTGEVGATGPAGPQGASGPQGPMGPIGATGPQGNDGMVGPQGPTGAPGPAGDVGATGPAGPQGATGPQGQMGPAGPGVPAGGTAGQVLRKVDATDFNTVWATPSLNVTTVVGGSVSINPGQSLALSALCPSGSVVVGGGYVTDIGPNPVTISVARNSAFGSSAWRTDIFNSGSSVLVMHAEARCISLT